MKKVLSEHFPYLKNDDGTFLCCSLKHLVNFESVIVASVNHKGDSDSTGAVTGNLISAMVGYDAIPQYYKDNLELHDVILHVADDLWRGETTKM